MKLYFSKMALMLATTLVLTGCGDKKTIGTPASADTPAVSLAEILAQPADYDGKTVVLLGTLAAQCPSLCDFTFRDNNQSVTIYMEDGKKAPRMPVGSPIRVTTSILQGERQIVFTARGLERL